MRVGVGWSTHRDPVQAGRAAGRAALKATGATRCGFALVFATTAYDAEAFLASARGALGGCPTAGCSVGAVSTRAKRTDSAHSVGVLAFEADDVGFRVARAECLSRDSAAAGARLAAALQAGEDAMGVLLLPDGLTADVEALCSGLRSGLPRRVPVFGALASDGLRMTETLQYLDGEVTSDACVAVLLSGGGAVDAHVAAASLPLGPARRVTRATGRALHEIDGQPALDALAEYVGEDAYDPDAPLVTMSLGLADAEGTRACPIVRRHPESRAIELAATAADGAPVRWMLRDPAHLDEALTRMRQAFGGRVPARLALHVEPLQLDEDARAAVAGLQRELDGEVPWLGIASHGEIASTDAGCALYHESVALMLLR